MTTLSKAEYLQRYLSSGKDEKNLKKKKSKEKTQQRASGLRIVEGDAFLAVSAKFKDVDSDEEKEDIAIIASISKQIEAKAREAPKFRNSFIPLSGAEEDVKPTIKTELLFDDEHPSTSQLNPQNQSGTVGSSQKKDNAAPHTLPIPHDPDTSYADKPRYSDSGQSPLRKRHDSDSDQSPVRKQHDSDQPLARQNRSSQSDACRSHDKSSVLDSKRLRRYDSGSSGSPARKKDKTMSSPRRRTRNKRFDSDVDHSPPRTRVYRGRQLRNSDSDLSPPRRSARSHKSNSSSDQSPTRKHRSSSPHVFEHKHRKRYDSDESPPRNRDRREPRERRIASPEKLGKETKKTLDGKVAGLQSADALKKESEKIRQREAELFEGMDAFISGRYAETKVREKQVRKKREKPEDKERKEREAKKQAELKEKYDLWNKGVAQLEQREQQLEEMARVAAEPLARMADDESMNRHLKEVIREEDPMAEMLLNKKRQKAIDQGELVYPTYQGECPPNRFGIRPGYRWDGVDRSNGFEAMLAQSNNRRNAQEKEYYQNLQVYE